jgi:hypothetical protein
MVRHLWTCPVIGLPDKQAIACKARHDHDLQRNDSSKRLVVWAKLRREERKIWEAKEPFARSR